MVDQYGIAHAPPAQPRALLIEHGFSDVIIILHNERGGIEYIPASVLLPTPPGVNLLTHDNFI